MKLKQKVFLVILIFLVVLTMNFIVLINSVRATDLTQISQVDLKYGGMCEQLLKYKGVIVKTTYVEYIYGGQSFPAYCLNKTLPRCIR